MKYPMHDRRASGHREQFAIDTDQSARRAVKERADLVPPRGPQLNQFRASFGERIHHVADEGLGDIDLDFFNGLEQHATLRVFAHQHPRAPGRKNLSDTSGGDLLNAKNRLATRWVLRYFSQSWS